MGICHLIVPVRVYEGFSYGMGHVTFWAPIMLDMLYVNTCQNDLVWFIEINKIIGWFYFN